jgi:hypothetical protein
MTKFTWHFKISADQEDLVIMLNGGVNVMIEINHETFHMHLAHKLNEILFHEHMYGTKTEILGMDAIQKAFELKK